MDQPQTPRDRESILLGELSDLVTEAQPELLDHIYAENAFWYGIIWAIDHAKKDVRKPLVDTLFSYLREEKNYGDIAKFATRSSFRELGIKVDGEELYQLSMRNEDYAGAHAVAEHLKLGKDKRQESAELFVNQQLDVLEAGEETPYTLEFLSMYTRDLDPTSNTGVRLATTTARSFLRLVTADPDDPYCSTHLSRAKKAIKPIVMAHREKYRDIA